MPWAHSLSWSFNNVPFSHTAIQHSASFHPEAMVEIKLYGHVKQCSWVCVCVCLSTPLMNHEQISLTHSLETHLFVCCSRCRRNRPNRAQFSSPCLITVEFFRVNIQFNLFPFTTPRELCVKTRLVNVSPQQKQCRSIKMKGTDIIWGNGKSFKSKQLEILLKWQYELDYPQRRRCWRGGRLSP